jgi:hypothetical protein
MQLIKFVTMILTIKSKAKLYSINKNMVIIRNDKKSNFSIISL